MKDKNIKLFRQSEEMVDEEMMARSLDRFEKEVNDWIDDNTSRFNIIDIKISLDTICLNYMSPTCYQTLIASVQYANIELTEN